MNRKYDWEKVAEDFLKAGYHSKVTLKVIAEQHGIPYQTVRRYATAHKWHSRRYRTWIKEKYGMDFEEHLKALYEEVMNRG
jgi:HD superfamily phosphohydrolase YqeK